LPERREVDHVTSEQEPGRPALSDPTWPRDRSTDPAQPTASRVAAGFIVFAVIMMIMTGVFQAPSPA
jgi:hypothetical protein